MPHKDDVDHFAGIVGYYRGNDLVYVAHVRNGFVLASRHQGFEKLRFHVIPEGQFVNLPEKHRSRWGEGLTAEDMKKCVWFNLNSWRKLNFWSGLNQII